MPSSVQEKSANYDRISSKNQLGMTNNSKKFTIVQFSMVYNQFIFIKNKLVLVNFTLQGIFQLFHTCNSCTHEAALFQNIYKFCTFLPKFSNIFPFFALFVALFLKNHMHTLTIQNRPCTLHSTKFFFFFVISFKICPKFELISTTL